MSRQPKRYAKGIAPCWYRAAEAALRASGQEFTSNHVSMVATDAWRCHAEPLTGL